MQVVADVVVLVLVALSVPNKAQAAQPIIVPVVAAVVFQTTAVVALVAVVVAVEEVLELRLNEISPIEPDVGQGPRDIGEYF